MMKEKQKKYEKPELKKIQLMAEEVLAVGCKFPSGLGPRLANCNFPGPGCYKQGS